MKISIVVVLSIIILAQQAPIEDLTQLPDYPNSSKMYSGYLPIDQSNQFFYVYVESQSSPEEDPLVLWLKGGPGCSSLLGFSQENGPAVFKFLQTTFVDNPYSWNNVANIIYLESPGGVGYNTGYNGENVTDGSSADQNLVAVIQFFKKFPELRSKKFFVAGESYAGVYVPFLAERIVKHNQNSNSTDLINLEGILVGNGVTANVGGTNFFLIGRDFVPEVAVKNYYECQADPNCNPSVYQIYLGVLTDGTEINPYNVYGKCVLPDQQYSGVPCADLSGPAYYFNRNEVKKAFRVSDEIQWSPCSSVLNYNGGGVSIQNYPILIENKVRILIYSGDADSVVPTPFTRNWIRTLNLTVKEDENWRVWNAEADFLGGFLTEYEEGFTFITVHGSGHMVPQYKPQQAFHFFSKFINNERI